MSFRRSVTNRPSPISLSNSSAPKNCSEGTCPHTRTSKDVGASNLTWIQTSTKRSSNSLWCIKQAFTQYYSAACTKYSACMQVVNAISPLALPYPNRPSELNRAIGPFINTLPLIPDWRPTDRFIRNIQRIHQDVMYLNEHHQINLNLLTERLKRSHADIVDLMQVVLTLHNFKAENKHSTLMLEPIPVSEAAEKFGISLIAQETPDTLRFTVSHSNARYPEWYVKALMDTFTALLATLDSHTLEH